MNKAINSVIHALPTEAAAGAPEWIQLLPASEFSGVDGRGPYARPDVQALIDRFKLEGQKLPIDENHATDLAGKQGHPAPSRGWIVDMQSRDNALWGKVQWTPEGNSLVAGHSYGFISPVFLHGAAKPFVISKMLRVALTNDPNLSLKSLHTQQETVMLEELRKALNLPETADEAAVLAAVTAAHTAQTAGAATTALMSRVAEAAGVAANVTGDALVLAIQSKGAATGAGAEVENASLKQQLVSMQSQLTTLATTTAKDKAETAIDGAIKAGKLVPALRDHFIARHMRAPGEVETELGMLVSLNAGGLAGRKPPGVGEPALTAEDDAVMAMMGVDPTAFATQAKALHGKDI